jgi:hypothetical protein
MQCDVCGREFLTTHACLSSNASEPQNSPPSGFALLHYLREAWRIVRWDGEAIRRVKDDPRVLPYGVAIWIFVNTVPFLLITYLYPNSRALSPGRVMFLLGVVLLNGAIVGLLHLGIVHLVAKYFCGGDGKFIQIIRPLLLTSTVFLLLPIPLVGPLLAMIAWVAVMVMVFDVVDSMEHLTAFLVSMATGVALRVVTAIVFKEPF